MTVGGYVRHNDFYSFKVEIDKQLNLARWRCSCGVKSEEYISTDIKGFRIILLKRWYKHVEDVHPQEIGDEDFEE